MLLITQYHRIAGKFRGRKLARISQICGYLCKFSSQNFGHGLLLAWHKRAIRRSFLHKNRIFYQFAKFSPSKVSHYTVIDVGMILGFQVWSINYLNFIQKIGCLEQYCSRYFVRFWPGLPCLNAPECAYLSMYLH